VYNVMDRRRSDMNNKKSMSKKAKILISVLSIFLCAALASGIYVYYELSKVKTVAISKTNEDLGISSETAQQEEKQPETKNITNIALFGVDSRAVNSDVNSRSDSIMILSIDEIHSKVKITSIMRDTYVAVDGHGQTKITHAYAYGGPALAIKTINENFNMNIRDYATVDFFSMEKIINKLGGIDINVKKYEIDEVNKYMLEAAKLEKKTPKKLTKSGMQHLNGMQAVSYARIRKVGNGDYERTERQRIVMETLFKKVAAAGLLKYPSLLDAVLPNVETSLSKGDILSLGTKVLSSGINNVDQLRLPEDGYSKSQLINKIYYLVADMTAAKKQLYNFVYEVDMPQGNTAKAN
jgi:polyisoprenyl-teichoic acid--peptidoglycan teichoic acid transferase